jgi:hypothetical protein
LVDWFIYGLCSYCGLAGFYFHRSHNLGFVCHLLHLHRLLDHVRLSAVVSRVYHLLAVVVASLRGICCMEFSKDCGAVTCSSTLTMSVAYHIHNRLRVLLGRHHVLDRRPCTSRVVTSSGFVLDLLHSWAVAGMRPVVLLHDCRKNR